MNPKYGKNILSINESILNHKPLDKSIESIDVFIPDDILISAEDDDEMSGQQFFD